MKKIIMVLFIGLFTLSLSAQTEKVDLYNPNANAKSYIANAVVKAKKER